MPNETTYSFRYQFDAVERWTAASADSEILSQTDDAASFQRVSWY